jgi:hypothetical protein
MLVQDAKHNRASEHSGLEQTTEQTIADVVDDTVDQLRQSEEKSDLLQLAQQLSGLPGEPNFDLKLNEEGRKLLFKGALGKRALSSGSNADSDLLHLFLFDHLLVVVEIKVVNKQERYRIYRKVPLHA